MPNKHKNNKPTSRKRHNISIADLSRTRGKRLAETDRRSFSNLLEVLIDAEWERRFPNGKKEAQAA